MITAYGAGASIRQIAEVHCRSEGDVASRLAELRCSSESGWPSESHLETRSRRATNLAQIRRANEESLERLERDYLIQPDWMLIGETEPESVESVLCEDDDEIGPESNDCRRLMDWSVSGDDLDSAYWENYFGGPDDEYWERYG